MARRTSVDELDDFAFSAPTGKGRVVIGLRIDDSGHDYLRVPVAVLCGGKSLGAPFAPQGILARTVRSGFWVDIGGINRETREATGSRR